MTAPEASWCTPGGDEARPSVAAADDVSYLARWTWIWTWRHTHMAHTQRRSFHCPASNYVAAGAACVLRLMPIGWRPFTLVP